MRGIGLLALCAFLDNKNTYGHYPFSFSKDVRFREALRYVLNTAMDGVHVCS
jgi:hypothetical protein